MTSLRLFVLGRMHSCVASWYSILAFYAVLLRCTRPFHAQQKPCFHTMVATTRPTRLPVQGRHHCDVVKYCAVVIAESPRTVARRYGAVTPVRAIMPFNYPVKRSSLRVRAESPT